MKKLLNSKKFWLSIATGIATGVSHYTGQPAIAEAIMVVGVALVAGIGLQDMGKEAVTIAKDAESKKSDE